MAVKQDIDIQDTLTRMDTVCARARKLAMDERGKVCWAGEFAASTRGLVAVMEAWCDDVERSRNAIPAAAEVEEA